MKINIVRKKPDEVQQFFSKPLDFSQRVEMKKLKVVEMILHSMKALGMNRTQLAEKMEVGSSRVTTMLNGSQNLTIETLMRAAEAVGSEVEIVVVPKTHQVRWVSYEEDDCHKVFRPQSKAPLVASTRFNFTAAVAPNDPCHAA